ncbi:hypothetical protein PVAND_014492 [Polypedilum vanderplanki]|uniref:Uncharacterized protein n=1 Tax=Polypedilum vanderplanki TaxID=319348 RepID=A0A9J6B9C1_POLVA|nr:hypothetical protein PVAND_014492 [Polypedilum vanderplanki]
MFTKFFFVFFLSTIFIYDTQAGAPSVDICAKPIYIYNSLLGKLQTIAQNIVDQGIQQINAYTKSNKKESPKKFEDDINLIVNNVFSKVQNETNKILNTLVANFPSITSTNAESYFFGGSPAG